MTAVGSTLAVGLLSNTVDNSIAASEAFFHQTLDASFNDPADGVTDLSAAPVSEFSSAMAKMTSAVVSTTDFVEGINTGRFGFTPTGAKAELERNNSQGRLRKS